MSEAKLMLMQEKMLKDFLFFSTTNSKWYMPYRGKTLCDFPILEKKSLIKNLYEIATIDEKKSVVSLTGGTTGSSMKVLYRLDDIQNRFALLDEFRASYGYSLGKRTAWFSGKNICNDKDILKGICFRDDYINKIRFFSTFHICEKNFNHYWNALKIYTPEYIIGFPSSIYEICRIALDKGLTLDAKVKVFFPTAETVTDIHRTTINKVLGCRIINQYASSEGAPFILECEKGGLHIHPLSGVFEVVDEFMSPAMEGELLITSFTTHGTPLIRYRIGDRIKLAPINFRCTCGSNFQVVESIEGRTTDYIWSMKNGRVNLGNISNCTKDVKGIISFQIIQNEVNILLVSVITTQAFNSTEEEKFKKALVDRVGSGMEILVKVVDDIPKEKSGKFSIVKNNLTIEDMSI